MGGRLGEDLARLQAVAAPLDRLITEPYVVSLDGNEQYKALDDFARLLEAMAQGVGAPALPQVHRLRRAAARPRGRARPRGDQGLAELGRVPLIIDESDGELDSFKAAVKLGYRGVSTKNCKGIFKSFLNRSLVERWNARAQARARLFMTAEDLTTLSVIPLHQDLATVRALGITHVERNGHHYVKGLAHCSPRERNQATRLHRDLYRGGETGRACASRAGSCAWPRSTRPATAEPSSPTSSSMTPLERWSFDSLEAES